MLEIDLLEERPALNFKLLVPQSVVATFKNYNIKCLPLTAGCTEKYQPLDVNFNGREKTALTQRLQVWLFEETARRMHA